MRVDSGNGSDPPSFPPSLPPSESVRPYARICQYMIRLCGAASASQGRLLPTPPFLRCVTRAFIIRYSYKYQMSPRIPGCTTNRCTPSSSFVRLRPPNFLSYIFLTPHSHNCPCFPLPSPPSSYPSPPASPIPSRALVFPSSPCFPQGHCTLHICSSSPPPLHLSWELRLRRWPFAVFRSVRHKHQSPSSSSSKPE